MKINVTFKPSEYEVIEWYFYTDDFWCYDSDGLNHIITKYMKPTEWNRLPL